MLVDFIYDNNFLVKTTHKQCKGPSINNIIFFWIFDTPLPHIGSFLVLSVGNFDQILTPPPSQLPTSFMDGP